jgi:chitin synthase
MSNILDKPLESFMGFIAVLPGAFSAYRYKAILGKPLQQYFMGEKMHGGDDIFAANMYLAEDRILCFELCTKKDHSWVLKYVKNAKAETDVPDGVPEFISQRRRWLNGSFFAGVHALTHWYYIFRSGHNILRKIMLILQFIYIFLINAFSWFSLANFYLTFYFLAKTLRPDGSSPLGKHHEEIFAGIRQIYIGAFVMVLVASLGNRPQGSKFIYILSMILFALIMAGIFYLIGFQIYDLIPRNTDDVKSIWTQRGQFRDMIISISGTYGVYFVASILYLDPWHMLTSFVQYMFLLPSFVNILMVYACMTLI